MLDVGGVFAIINVDLEKNNLLLIILCQAKGGGQ